MALGCILAAPVGQMLGADSAAPPALDNAALGDAEPQLQPADPTPLTLEELDNRVRRLAETDDRVRAAVAAIDAGTIGSPHELLGAPGALPEDVRADTALRVAAEHFARREYEQCLEWLDHADPERVSSRELLWHYRAVAHHQLVQMDQAGEAAEQLLGLGRLASRRAKEIATLIQRDVAADKPGSLDHIAHQMSDVRRRLMLGRAGEENQMLQQEVIAALDKLIEKAEEQQKQQQMQQQMAQGGGSDSSRPMQDSRPAELKAAGETDDRELPPGGDWGSLPPAERERVTQQIIRDFPAYYRAVIEDYFRSLATGDAADPDAREGQR